MAKSTKVRVRSWPRAVSPTLSRQRGLFRDASAFGVAEAAGVE
jgi:hypothetical protein